MRVLFTEVLEELRELGVAYVGVDVGDENQYFHRRDLVVHAAPGEHLDAGDIRDELDDIEDVNWQGRIWKVTYGVSPQITAESNSTHDVYSRGERIELEPLLDAYRETWMEELSNCSLDELTDDKRWRLRARKMREASNHELSPRMAEVYVLDEIGRSKAEIASVLDISEMNVENRRQSARERLGDRYGTL